MGSKLGHDYTYNAAIARPSEITGHTAKIWFFLSFYNY